MLNAAAANKQMRPKYLFLVEESWRDPLFTIHILSTMNYWNSWAKQGSNSLHVEAKQ